jgi:hypothetical protein
MEKVDQIIDLLEQDDSLALGASPWANEIDEESTEVRQVDWRKLFPTRRPTDQGTEHDWEMYGDGWEFDLREFEEVFEGSDDLDAPVAEEWDVCAWYQPIHFHGYDWGIFIREECLKRLARKIFLETGFNPTLLPIHDRAMLAKGLMRTAFSVFYHHELFHHKTECLGLRIHAVQRRSSYLPYFNNVYKVTAGTDDQLEEALANAFMYRDLDESTWISNSLAVAARSYLTKSFPINPPGYRLAPRYLSNRDFDTGQRNFFSQVLEGNLHPRHASKYWTMAPRINHAIFNVKADIWTVVPRGKKSIVPNTATPLRTCSTEQIVRVCGRHGYTITQGGKGSHIKLKKSGSPTIIVPGNRDNVSPGVAKNILASLGYKINQLPDLI